MKVIVKTPNHAKRISKRYMYVDVKRKCKQCGTVTRMNDIFDFDFDSSYDLGIFKDNIGFTCPICNKSNKLSYFQNKRIAMYIKYNEIDYKSIKHLQVLIRNHMILDPYFLYEAICLCRILGYTPIEVSEQPLFDKISDGLDRAILALKDKDSVGENFESLKLWLDDENIEPEHLTMEHQILNEDINLYQMIGKVKNKINTIRRHHND